MKIPAKVDCESKNAIMSVSQFYVPLSLKKSCRDGGVYHCRANGYLIPNMNTPPTRLGRIPRASCPGRCRSSGARPGRAQWRRESGKPMQRPSQATRPRWVGRCARNCARSAREPAPGHALPKAGCTLNQHTVNLVPDTLTTITHANNVTPRLGIVTGHRPTRRLEQAIEVFLIYRSIRIECIGTPAFAQQVMN